MRRAAKLVAMSGDLVVFLACFLLGTVVGIVRQMVGTERHFDAQVIWVGFYSGFTSLSASIPTRDYYKMSVAMTIFTALSVSLGGVATYRVLSSTLVRVATRTLREALEKGGVDDMDMGGGPGDRPAPGGGGRPTGGGGGHLS